MGFIKPTGPIYIAHNSFDPLVPYRAAHRTAADRCTKAADVQFWTNEQPPPFNKLDINNLLPLYVDGERGMTRLADRFNGVPLHPTARKSRGKLSRRQTVPSSR